MKFATFDIEANNWKDHVVTGLFFENEFNYFLEFSDFMETILNRKCPIKTIYSHFGGIYDHLFVIDYCVKNNIEINSLIIQGRKVLSFKIKYKKRIIKFIDSSGILPFGLKKLCEMFETKTKKLDFSFINKIKADQKTINYLKNDCIALHEILSKYCELEYIIEIGLPLTQAGQAFKVFTEYFYHDLEELPNSVESFARKALYGGRTEIFKPDFLNNDYPLFAYDINSLYPYVQSKYDFPNAFKRWSCDLELSELSISDVLIESPDHAIPFLPCKINNKLMFPIGTFRGVYASPELNFALSLGYKIKKCYKTAVFENAGKIFTSYVHKNYKKRLDSKNDGVKLLYKSLLNNLWGRISMDTIRQSLSLDINSGGFVHSKIQCDDHEVRFYMSSKKIFSKTNVAMGLFTPMYGRIEIYKQFQKANFNIFYSDTDSIYTPETLPTGKNLGELKKDGEYKEWYGLQPKCYASCSLDGKMSYRVKGIKDYQEKNHFDNGNWTLNDFKNSLDGEIKLKKVKQQRGLAGLRTALKKGEILTVLEDNYKGINKLDEKRIWIKTSDGYTTIPHIVDYDPKTKQNILVTMS